MPAETPVNQPDLLTNACQSTGPPGQSWSSANSPDQLQGDKGTLETPFPIPSPSLPAVSPIKVQSGRDSTVSPQAFPCPLCGSDPVPPGSDISIKPVQRPF
ncbi:Hypothetical predicted protein [Marmota monax]|uniref:Uncharacterized protein n=1 Tax=Marmota monax TaxID=9995 RepID=A0A5E4C542_MARMO|nr:Hypothetical predicted protein [Marmota monax]